MPPLTSRGSRDPEGLKTNADTRRGATNFHLFLPSQSSRSYWSGGQR